MFGLAVFALALPLVRILVDAPEFLIAHQLGTAATLAYFAAIIVVVPAAIAALGALPGRWGGYLRAAIVGVLCLLAVAGIAQPVSSLTGVFWLIVVAGGVGLAVAEHRRPAVRSTLAASGVLALLLGAWVVGPSRVGSFVRSGSQTAVASTTVGTDTPVVVVVLDEFSLVPVLDGELGIDDQKFPNLAALADTSHWFRLASSISPQTSASVPALLSGVEADPERVPVGSQYPTNLFRWLARSHDVAAYEPITSLCGALCDLGHPTSADATPARSIGDLVDDTGIVLRHALGSDEMRRDLPSLAQGWAGFRSSGAAGGEDAGPKEGGYGTFFSQTAELQRLLRTEPLSDRPVLRVAHLIAPHLPWVAMPDGTVHSGVQPAGLTQQGAALTWGSDQGQRRAGYQRYELQLGALDEAIGAMRDTLEEQGIWDEALVVVTADHGLQFQPGTLRSVQAGGVEVTSVPLLIKEPGQTRGRVDDGAALTMDIVPTILGALGIEAPRGVEGLDLLHDDVPERRPGAFLAVPVERVTPDQRRSALQAAVDRRSSWIDPDGGWDAVYQAGIAEPLVGRPLGELGAASPGGRWSRVAGEAGRRVTYSISGEAGARQVLLVCEGTIAGVVPVAGAADPLIGAGYASHEHCADPDAVELATRDSAGAVSILERTS